MRSLWQQLALFSLLCALFTFTNCKHWNRKFMLLLQLLLLLLWLLLWLLLLVAKIYHLVHKSFFMSITWPSINCTMSDIETIHVFSAVSPNVALGLGLQRSCCYCHCLLEGSISAESCCCSVAVAAVVKCLSAWLFGSTALGSDLCTALSCFSS